MEDKSLFDQVSELNKKQDESIALQKQMSEDISAILNNSHSSVIKSDALKKTPHTRDIQADDVKKTVEKRNQAFSLKNFINRSRHEYLWMGSEEEFEKDKNSTLKALWGSIAVMILCTLVSTASFGLYSTFTLFENIWLLLTFFLLKYTYKARKVYSSLDYSNNSFEIFVTDSDGVLRATKYKKKYTRFFFISCFAFLLNVLSAWLTDCSAPFWTTVFELSALGLNIYTVYKVIDFFAAFGPIKFSGMNDNGTKNVVLVFDPMMNRLYTEEEFFETFSFMK